MGKNEKTYRLYILLIILSFFSCENESKHKNNKLNNSFSPPVKISASNPIVTLLDTCPKPAVIVLPKKGVNNYSILTNDGSHTISLTPPKIIPLTNGEAGGYTYMQNYNTEQGLALSNVACGYMDKVGNLWFGTSGGGVSKYDGKSFTNFTATQGLANNIVRSITEDTMGNLWFSTAGGGVSKYNGKYFKTFTTANGLASNKIFHSYTDRTGSIWFGTEDGLSKYDPTKKNKIKDHCFTNFTIAEGLLANNISGIIEDKMGNLWFGTNQGISKYDPTVKNKQKLFKNYIIAKDQENNNGITFIGGDNKGNIWFSTKNNVCKYDPTIEDWATKKHYTSFSISQDLLNSNVYDIIEDDKEQLWFTSAMGVSKYDLAINSDTSNDKNFTHFTTTEGLANTTVLNVTKDKSGNLWFGTNGGGLSKYTGKSITSFTIENGLTSTKVWCISEDKKGNLWFGTSSGVSKYDGKRFTNFRISYALVNVRGIYEDKLGNLWFSSSSGVSKYDGKSFTLFTVANGLIDNSVISIVEDKAGNLWFGTYGAGVSRYDGNRVEAIRNGENILKPDQNDIKKLNGKPVKSFTNFTTAHGLINNTIKCILADKSGNIWFGTNAGVSKYDGKTFTNYTTAQGLSHNIILSIFEDKRGDIWFGTGGGGVCKFDPSVKLNTGSKFFTAYTSANGLADNMVYGIVEDTINNIIWFGTNLGLSGLKLSSIVPLDGVAKFENFNNITGYSIKDVNTGALSIDKNGIIWAGTGDKLVRFDYSDIHKSTTPPIVHIQALKIQGEPISWYNLHFNKYLNSVSEINENRNFHDRESVNSEDSLTILNEEVLTFGSPLIASQREVMRNKFSDIKFDSISRFYPLPQNLQLPFKHNNVSFEFVAVETDKPQLVGYQYFLEGYDNNWSPVTDKTTASFGNIYEGSYTFKLKARSPDGIWSEPITYKFKVLPPWYRTWWMYLIYLLALLSAIAMFFRWRTASLRKEKEILEQTVKARTAQVVEQKELIEEKQKEIVDSINYAKRIQYTLLANDKLLQQNLNEYFVLFKPKDIVSGDFYWATKVLKSKESEVDNSASDAERFYLAICDSTGHGVPGAFMSLLNISFLNEAITEKNIHQPNEILNHVRQRLIESVSQDGAQDGMDGILVCVENGKVTYAAANNAPVIIRDNVIRNLKTDKMPIGKGENNDPFTLHTIDKQTGDMLYFYTDGYADQFGGPKGKKFKYKQLEELLISIHQKPMKEQKDVLEATIKGWQGNLEQVDDILLIGLRIG